MRLHRSLSLNIEGHRRGRPHCELPVAVDGGIQHTGLLVATTNVESSLDNALFRRFDEVFQVPLPGPEEIEKLLRRTLSVRVAEELNWGELVKELSGASAAMSVKAAQDAAKAAVLCGEKIVTEPMLRNAIGEVKHGNGENSQG